MIIEKHYEENIIVGNYQSVKVGITLKSDKVLNSLEEIASHSKNLNILAKDIVRRELKQIKEERQQQTQEEE